MLVWRLCWCGRCSNRPRLEIGDNGPKLLGIKRVILLCAMAALAACAGQKPAPEYGATARRLDRAGAEIAPPLGATTYTLDPSRLDDLPGGENAPLERALLQLPGVSPVPNGRISVRGQ